MYRLTSEAHISWPYLVCCTNGTLNILQRLKLLLIFSLSFRAVVPGEDGGQSCQAIRNSAATFIRRSAPRDGGIVWGRGTDG